MASLLSINNLTIGFGAARPVVENVSFDLRPGEVLGLVGESGSGKTTIALSILGHRAWNTRISGQILFEGHEMLRLKGPALRKLRGRRVAYMPQNPAAALNPSRRIGSVLREFLKAHDIAQDEADIAARSQAALASFGFGSPMEILNRYPHQLSGGQQQRVVLALATICDPAVLVLDEPTTGLDVSTQRTVLELLAGVRDVRATAMVYVTHDLGVLKDIATHIAVLYAGRLMEHGPVDGVFGRPLHPYTRGLLGSRPTFEQAGSSSASLHGLLERSKLPLGCPFAPRCDVAHQPCFVRVLPLLELSAGHFAACDRTGQISAAPAPAVSGATPPRRDIVLRVENVSVSYRQSGPLSLFGESPAAAVRGASFEISKGEILALVGESGSGKSTLAKAIAGLVPAEAGHIFLGAEELRPDVSRRLREERRRVQLVFQNPDASLNPRRRIGQILVDALSSFQGGSSVERGARVLEILRAVRLPEDYAQRFPDQLSGGERQRVAIARALIVKPDVLICDEVLSALDVSVQAGILDLLAGLARRSGVALLFISHDLAVVHAIAHRIGVLFRGELLAFMAEDELLRAPVHPYVHELLANLPGEHIASPAKGAMIASKALPMGGCPFVTRCPVAREDKCASVPPPWWGTMSKFRCHRSAADLKCLLPLPTGELHEQNQR